MLKNLMLVLVTAGCVSLVWILISAGTNPRANADEPKKPVAQEDNKAAPERAKFEYKSLSMLATARLSDVEITEKQFAEQSEKFEEHFEKGLNILGNDGWELVGQPMAGNVVVKRIRR